MVKVYIEEGYRLLRIQYTSNDRKTNTPGSFSCTNNLVPHCVTFLKKNSSGFIDKSVIDEPILKLTDTLRHSQNTLEYLNLSSNNLDEAFIQKFTLSQRLKFNDFDKLVYIDVSMNYKIRSLDFLKYFTKYSHLNEVVVSVLKNETVFMPNAGGKECEIF